VGAGSLGVTGAGDSVEPRADFPRARRRPIDGAAAASTGLIPYYYYETKVRR
jgi:hypothetical protein